MNSPAVTDNSTNEIPSLLIPMAGHKLVLPTVSVAEMIAYQSPQSNDSLSGDSIPHWYLGNLLWRGILVPMMSYEALNGEAIAPIQSESQVLILNGTGVNAQIPFLCIPTQGIPRLSRVAVNEISENEQAETKQFDQMQVFVAGEQAVIPDVSQLEVVCANLLGYA